MSDPVVIAAFEARLGTLTTPYVDTLNTRPPTLPDEFTALERDFSAVDRITIGKPNTQFRETGTLTVVVSVRAGTGSNNAAAIAEQARALFHNYALGHLQIMTVGSAAVFDPDDGSYFQLKVPVQYQFDFFV